MEHTIFFIMLWSIGESCLHCILNRLTLERPEVDDSTPTVRLNFDSSLKVFLETN